MRNETPVCLLFVYVCLMFVYCLHASKEHVVDYVVDYVVDKEVDYVVEMPKAKKNYIYIE